MVDYRCPNCDGPFELQPHSSTVVCPYCSTTVQVKTGEVIKEIYIMRVQFDLDKVRDKMFSWATKQLGAPKDLEAKAEIKEGELVYYPFWVVEVEAKADYAGTQRKPDFGSRTSISKIGWNNVHETGHIDIEQDIFVPAMKDTPKQLDNYVIPTKRKEFFSKDLIAESGGKLRPIQIDRDNAVDTAQRRMREILNVEARKEVDNITEMNASLNVPAVFLVHIPVWHVKYGYSLRSYDALVDAASGRVISLKFPRKMAFRATVLFGGLIHLGVGGGLGLLLVYIGYLWGNPLFPTVFGIVLGLGMLAISLRFFRTAISIRAEEEMAE